MIYTSAIFISVMVIISTSILTTSIINDVIIIKAITINVILKNSAYEFIFATIEFAANIIITKKGFLKITNGNKRRIEKIKSETFLKN